MKKLGIIQLNALLIVCSEIANKWAANWIVEESNTVQIFRTLDSINITIETRK